MNISDIVSDSVRYPSSNWKKVVILGILFIISFLIIPVFLVMGYVFRVLKASLAGLDELPEFDEWGEMFIDGIKIFVVEFVYFIIPAIVILLGTWGAITSMIATQGVGSVAAPTALLGLSGGALVVGIILAIIFGLVAVIAIANMAYYNGELGAAFRFSEILGIISQIGWVNYIIWYIVMMVIGFIGGIIASILNIIPLIGFVIAVLVVYPYLYMVFARSLALLFTSIEPVE